MSLRFTYTDMRYREIMPERFFKYAIFTLLLHLSMLASANAQSWFERLVMPGELVESHSKLESKCSNCHEAFSRQSQRHLCLDCHKDIARDVNEKRGFHGKRPEIDKQECSHCHTDHTGRNADIVLLDEETFDHESTDFLLRDAHKKVTCNQCHQPDKKFSAAPLNCVDCHLKDEPHRGGLGKECATCHSQTTWVSTKAFDHSQTKFPLKETHANVACKACHIGEVYKDLPTTCAECHRIQDVHRGRFGSKCETCHSPSKWTEVRFNHDRDTKFELLGKHAKVKCDACHIGDIFTDKLTTNCVACHDKTDPHQDQLGKACDQCHSPESWRDKVVFEHDITRFPLIGLHALVPCEACHITPAYRDAPINCADCHKGDDYHEGRLGKTCTNCHNPNGWKRWVFDHDSQTRYRLTGSHSGLECRACHTKSRAASMKISKSCVACHARDDKHNGTFGSNCATCHVTGKFKNVRLRR